jgi:hypothetical protein
MPTKRARKTATPRRKQGGVTFDTVRALARELPGAEESTSYGTAAIKVKGKLLIRLKEDGQTIVLITTFTDRDFLMQSDPETFYITDHYRNYPSVLARMARLGKDQLRQLLEDAWRRAAPRKLVEEYDGP